MSFDWKKYLELARSLAARPDEASLRSAVSRAYYCAFNLALSRAQSNQYKLTDDGSSHDLLWSLYQRNDDIGCHRLSVIGGRMKRRRVKADYRALVPKLQEEVLDALADAEECVRILDSLPGYLPRDVPRRFSF